MLIQALAKHTDVANLYPMRLLQGAVQTFKIAHVMYIFLQNPYDNENNSIS